MHDETTPAPARDPVKKLNSLRNLNATAGMNSNERSHQNQERVLTALSRFGWLPLKQVGMLCWPNDKTTRCAERTLATLRKRREVTYKERPDRSRIYTLTAVGAERVENEMGLPVKVDPEFGKRGEPQFEHRCLSNALYNFWERDTGHPGAAYFTEHEIMQGRAPLRSYSGKGFEKIPDGLLLMDTDLPSAKRLGWVETERSHKNNRDQEHLVEAICCVLSLNGKGLSAKRDNVTYDVGFVVVVCPTETLKVRLCEFLFAYLKANKWRHTVPRVLACTYIFDPAARDLVSVRKWTETPAWAADRAACGMPLPPDPVPEPAKG